MFKIIIAIIAVTVVVIVGFMVIDPKLNTTNFDSTLVSENNTTSYPITLEGEIAKPGTYSLDEGVTMAEAITAAGGLTTNADTLAFFENVVLEKGKTYFIASQYDNSDICNTNPIVKVNINQDDASILSGINAITPTIANSIVEHRKNNGIFETLEDLLKVYGIGNATYTKIRNFVTLHEWFCFS